MEFSPNNPVVRLCIQGMGMEEKGLAKEAAGLFLQAWDEATDDFEKFLSAHFLARCQGQALDKLRWLETALHLAQAIDDDAVRSAFPPLYLAISNCHAELGDPGRQYLWILNREPAMKQAVYDKLLLRLKALGLDAGRLISSGPGTLVP